MNDRARIFSNDELLEILSLSPNATAIYTTENLIIQAANDAMIAFWGKDRNVIGKKFEEAVPELIGQPFFDLLRNVWRTGITFEAIDTAAELRVDGKLQTFYFDFVYRAIKNEQGQVHCILHTASDVTERIATRRYIRENTLREQQLNEELATVNEELVATNEELAYSQNDLLKLNQQLEDRIERRTKELSVSKNRLNSMVMTAPIGMTILQGRELVVEIANKYMFEIWNKRQDEIVGLKLIDVFPELKGQPFPRLLANVFDTGEKIAMDESEAVIASPDGDRLLYLNFSYDPLFDAEGNVESIMATVINVTDTVKARKAIEESEKEQQALNEELTATNEELASANEELVTSNEELAATQAELTELLEKLSESEAKFRTSVQQAPVAIGVLRTRDLIIDSANDSMLQVWGKTEAVRGLSLAVALPELEGQPFLQILDDVYTSGKTFYGTEAKVDLERNGRLGEYYFDFIYKALENADGGIDSIMVVAVDVTVQVNARNELKNAEEMLRFSVEAANVGTWFLDTETREFIGSPRLKELFGFYADEDVSYEMVAGQIPDGYEKKIKAAIEKAITTGERYNMEHPVIGYHDKRRRWIRGIGKLYTDQDGKGTHFSGLVIDITEQKEDEMRKNDFIGMVSHELKTPLTSLSAIIQMLGGKAKTSDDKFTSGALDKAYTQARKMSAMINGFLNISRLESGKMHINKQQFDISELLKEMVDETRLTAASHFVTMHTAKRILVNADQDKIASVISNLLSNAVKYSERGTTIDVRCKIDGENVLVSVKDEGLGIKQQDIDKLFERYYRVESSNTRHISGFGIGLYLSAEIIQRHDGKIWVESEVDKGSTFYFTLLLE